MRIDLRRLAEPFDATDIEWRVARAGNGAKGIYCLVLAYITARAIQARLDEVCGPENWRVEEPRIVDCGKLAFAVGISIRVEDEWITKWDVAEPTNVEPAKGGFSGAMKRAGAQWGIGRYLYHLDETYAETAESPPDKRGWNYAKLSQQQGGATYYWKTPKLPAWALPQSTQLCQADINVLKQAWKKTFAPDSRNAAELREGFVRFVQSILGDFPIDDASCWTADGYERCMKRIETTTDPNGPSSDIPFEA